MTIKLYKIRHKKTGFYYNTRAGGVSKSWSAGGRFYTKRNLGNIPISIRMQADLEEWFADRVSGVDDK